MRAALRLVALGEAEFGIVYATDASADSTVHIRATFDAASHPPIRYPAAQVAGSTPAAAALLDYLKSAEARAIFAAQGFITEGLE